MHLSGKSSSVDATKTPPEPISFHTAYQNVFVLLERQFAKHGVKLEARGLDAAPRALAKLHPVEQVLINLLTNARDAVAERMGTDPTHTGKILVTARAADGFVELRVTDNGAGIPDTLRSRIFDPFFSTKETGKGMGLGLSISFSIAHSFGGELLLESTSSTGTTFVLRLPEANVRKQRSAA
jgi:C4-dicarboxylate-specific signal transduction histidine kinase